MSKLTKALTAAAGNAGESLYVEDVFSTYVYAGNSTAGRAIVNGIDLSGEGGMVWHKRRTGTGSNHALYDTERGATKNLRSNQTNAESTSTGGLTSFNSNGFTYGTYQETGYDYASWTFRKAEKFFDVVTWTGDGTGTRTIAHNLNGGQPGCIIVKRTDAASDWMTFNLDGSIYRNLVLNSTAAENATRTATDIADESVMKVSFMEGWAGIGNASGETYVAYLFASDAGGFGDDGSESIIKCGSYIGAGGGTPVAVDLGFEPQFMLIKGTVGTSDWHMFDNMRGVPTGGEDARLWANKSDAETLGVNAIEFTATGCNIIDMVNSSSDPYIYIAIRRPMKTPESGTEVFKPTLYTGNSSTQTLTGFGFPADIVINKNRSSTASPGSFLTSRLTGGGNHLRPHETSAELTGFGSISFDEQDGITLPALGNMNGSGTTYVDYAFKRATGFFDVVAYTGTGATGLQINHNLGVAPEMIIVKNRGSSWQWAVYHKDLGEHNGGSYIASKNLTLNTTAAETTNSVFSQHSDQTDSVFTLGYTNSAITYASGNTYIAYLFATLAGVSKVGSYTGTGSNVDVDCGFSAGARFILIKRTDSTGDWYVWDTERGITAGNDPYLLLNTTAAEVTSTDYIDPLASGFTVTSSAPAALNASGGSYIFLAIA